MAQCSLDFFFFFSTRGPEIKGQKWNGAGQTFFKGVPLDWPFPPNLILHSVTEKLFL